MPAKLILPLLFVLFITSCSDSKEDQLDNESEVKKEIEFDATKWKVNRGDDYPYRDDMLKDLMNNDSIRQLKRDQLLDLLGEPGRIDSNYFFYRIDQTRMNFITLHAKTLVIHLSEDSTIKWMKIHE